MKNIKFAMAAMLIAVAVTSCKESNFDKTIILVTEVTENSISGSCTYTPSKKNDDGYMIFLCWTDELTNEMREAMIEAYSMVQPLHESQSFTFDSLASDRTYYIFAVTYNKKTNGEVALGNIETLAQRTMASNDNRVTTSVNGQKVTLTMAIDDNGYTVDLNDVLGGNEFSYKLHIVLSAPTVVDSISGTNCYQDGKIVFTVDCDKVQTVSSVTEQFYAYAPTENENEYKKYVAEVRLNRRKKPYVQI